MAQKLYASPTFLFREHGGPEETQEAARSFLKQLLSTKKGSVISAPEFGLPPLSDFSSDSANQDMVDAIAIAIQTYLPQLENRFGTLHVESETKDNETIFLVYFQFEDEDEEIELSTRYVDARWVVLSRD